MTCQEFVERDRRFADRDGRKIVTTSGTCPRRFELALRSRAWHVAEHACFFTAGLLFWWHVVRASPSRPHWSRAAMIPYLLLADLQNTPVRR